MPGLYYLVLWKGYPEKDNTWEPSSAVIHLRKLISTFHNEHPEKPTATSPPLDSAPPMAGPTIPKEPKRKCGCPSKGANKRGRNQSIKNIRALPFMAPDVDVVLKRLIQSFQTPRPYPQSISARFSSIVLLAKVLEVFHPLQTISALQIGFPHQVQEIFYRQSPRFSLLIFSSSLGGFFTNQTHTVSSSVFHWVEEVFSPMPRSQTPTRSSELASKRERNCNIMKSCDQLRDGSNQIGTIFDHY